MKYLIILSSFIFLTSCDPVYNWLEAIEFEPIDTIHIDTIPIDTLPVDTIPVDTVQVDTCTDYIEHTDPQFVGLYIKFDFPQDSILWEGVGISSYDLGEVVSHVTTLPFTYGSDSIGAWVLIEGTNNHQQFQTKVFTRTPGGKWYFGTGKQEIWATGMTASEFKQNISTDYKSVDMFTFYGTNWDSTSYVQNLREILKDCHAGRRYADLYFIPYQLEQTLIDSFYLAGWDRVRTN